MLGGIYDETLFANALIYKEVNTVKMIFGMIRTTCPHLCQELSPTSILDMVCPHLEFAAAVLFSGPTGFIVVI